MELFVQTLTSVPVVTGIDCPIVDRTGLQGNYAFALKFVPVGTANADLDRPESGDGAARTARPEARGDTRAARGARHRQRREADGELKRRVDSIARRTARGQARHVQHQDPRRARHEQQLDCR